MPSIEEKRLAHLREELDRTQKAIAELEAEPKEPNSMLHKLLSKVRGGKVPSDLPVIEQYHVMLLEWIKSNLETN